jgi:CRISPR-associated protein Cas10/Cmr2 subtype III-B
MNNAVNAEFWKRKLAAYLHDPPSKCLDISTHGERSDAAFRQAGFTDEEVGSYFNYADHTGAAADRLPFPDSRAAGLSCAFDGIRNAFHHPLGGDRLRFHQEFRSVEEGFEGENSVQPALADWPSDWDEGQVWRARFFAHWRLWPQAAADRDYRLALLPADTRLPDHTIWTHMQVVSALAGCVDEDRVWRPAFLKFQIGPVQEFIAQARSTRDLWSGSYLLSWLMAAGLKRFSEQFGPDAVIYPSLRGQPLFDLHWKKDLWDKVRIGTRPVWHSIDPGDKEALLTPNLPNVFLALVPERAGAKIASAVEAAIREEFQRIAESVWEACEKAGLTNNPEDSAFRNVDRRARFNAQIERFLSVSWQLTPWPETPEEALKLVEKLPLPKDDDKDDNQKTLLHRTQTVLEAAQEEMPCEHRDRRYYTDDKKTKLNNVGIAWALLTALNSWQLDAVRQTRPFKAWTDGGWRVGTACNKDSLTGKEEAVAGGEAWRERCDRLAGGAEGSSKVEGQASLANRFKHDDWLGAISLVKRLWDLTYLEPRFQLKPWKMPNTHGLARHAPLADDDDAGETGREPRDEGERYFAVLVFDGDQIGRWIAGDKCPKFRDQLASYTDGSGRPAGALEYFQRDSDPDGQVTLRERFAPLLETRRPVSPSYHLQFSEALSNFALYCVRPIVEVYDGRLIYAGGDDVVALLPADTALECARALQLAFTGAEELPTFLQTAAEKLLATNRAAHRRPSRFQERAAQNRLLQCMASGWLARMDRVDQNGYPVPFLVPGPKASASVGIAIAHAKHPLQDAVREAQVAEKRAKRDVDRGGLGRSAVAVTLLKRSGETMYWGCRWDGRGLDACRLMIECISQRVLSSKFPHRLAELLEPYLTEATPLLRERKAVQPVTNFPVKEVVFRELTHCLERQRGPRFSEAVAHELLKTVEEYVEQLIQLSPTDRTEQADQTEQPDKTERPDKRDPASIERIIRDLIGLCQTVAFIERNLPGADDTSGSAESNPIEMEPQPAERQTAP